MYLACTLSTSVGWGATITSAAVDPGYDDGRRWGDVNGDGRADYCRIIGSVNYAATNVVCRKPTLRVRSAVRPQGPSGGLSGYEVVTTSTHPVHVKDVTTCVGHDIFGNCRVRPETPLPFTGTQAKEGRTGWRLPHSCRSKHAPHSQKSIFSGVALE
jgi:hypothetical protein